MESDLLLITGASSDIGLELIRRLAGAPGRPVILAHCCNGAARLEELREELQSDSIHVLSADFASADAVMQLASEIKTRFGVPSQVVHLPGLKLLYERFTKFNWDHVSNDLNVQIRSAVILLKSLLPSMAKMPAAQVLFLISNVTSGIPPKFLSMYTVVKYAQLGLMRALASEYSDTAVRINAVCPGMVETRFLENIPDLVRQMNAASSPAGRNATPGEVVSVIAALLANRSACFTGLELPVKVHAG